MIWPSVAVVDLSGLSGVAYFPVPWNCAVGYDFADIGTVRSMWFVPVIFGVPLLRLGRFVRRVDVGGSLVLVLPPISAPTDGVGFEQDQYLPCLMRLTVQDSGSSSSFCIYGSYEHHQLKTWNSFVEPLGFSKANLKFPRAPPGALLEVAFDPALRRGAYAARCSVQVNTTRCKGKSWACPGAPSGRGRGGSRWVVSFSRRRREGEHDRSWPGWQSFWPHHLVGIHKGLKDRRNVFFRRSDVGHGKTRSTICVLVVFESL